MSDFSVELIDGAFHIDGIPDGAKVISLTGSDAKHLSDYQLHKDDLAFARESLKVLIHTEEHNHFMIDALWRSAIVHYFKCFSRDGRQALPATKIHTTGNAEDDSLIAIIFTYFKGLRDKHFVHDENSYLLCLPLAVINNGQKQYKVEKVACLKIRSETISSDNVTNLLKLIELAEEFASKEIDRLEQCIAVQLESQTYSELCSFPPPVYVAPSADDAVIAFKKRLSDKKP